MTQDIIEGREAVLELDPGPAPADPSQSAAEQILFDPRAFQEAHEDLSLDNYAIGDAGLLGWAQRSSAIRACFKEEIEKLREPEPQALPIAISD